jgi:phosphate acetyltransferase
MATLVGDVSAIEAGLRERGMSTESVELLDTGDDEVVLRTRDHVATRRAGRGDSADRLDQMARDPVMQAATHVALGNADAMVAGCVRTTADVIRAALTCIGLAEGISTLSSSFYMVLAHGLYDGSTVLTFADAGVVPDPTPTQLAEIAASAAAARTSIVGDEARVAFLSYATKGSAAGPAVEKVREACALFRRAHPGIPADGELQGDAALSVDVAARKAPGSPVAGRANVLVFPDLGAANIAYKLVQYLGGAVALGPVLQGLARPCTDLSRGAVAQDIVAISCIASLMAE